MKQPPLPRDVQDYVRKKHLKEWLWCTVTFLTVCGILFFFGDRLFSAAGKSRYLLYVFLLLLPFYLTKAPLQWLDRNWCGKVTKISTTSFERSKSLGRRARFATVCLVILTVEKENGTVKEIEAMRTRPANLDKALSHFRVGDTVCHYRGLKELLVIPAVDDSREARRCLVCGFQNRERDEVCSGCGHSMIPLHFDAKENEQHA